MTPTPQILENTEVLVACEFSGIVRRAFRLRGMDAWSCDFLPAEDGDKHHFQCDVEAILTKKPWKLMIAHPPCTYLANSGVRWLYGDKGKTKDLSRWQNMEEAALFFSRLLDADIPRVAVENPIMHRYGKEIIGASKYEQQTQIVQPWMFGHGETKATCLTLKNLPKLFPTRIVLGRTPRVHLAPPSPERWKERSRTLPGLADAMAEQWGVNYIIPFQSARAFRRPRDRSHRLRGPPPVASHEKPQNPVFG